MNQDEITSENNVFNRQQSTHVNHSELLIAVWLRRSSLISNINFDSIKSKIENSADLLRVFNDDPAECGKYIRSCSNSIKIFLILSHEYAQILLENLHELQLIHSIYIYGTKEEINNYSKVMIQVVNVYTDLNILTDELSSMIYKYSRYAQLPITIFKQRYEQEQTANLLNKFAYFVDFWNPLFIDLLLELPEIDYDQQKVKFIEQCRIYYRANHSVMKVIDEFENTYKPELSILWYKRDAFVYRLLNKVMRQQNIEGILTFRFFILDLFKQLNKIYHEFIDSSVYEDDDYFSVYRGQMMFDTELDNLKKNLTHGPMIISINSFFSASRTQQVALDFSGATDALGNFSQNMKSVLFEIQIHIDYKMPLKRKPFADVSHLSDREKYSEQEIIFMVGSFFQIDDIKPIETLTGKGIVTLIKLTLINEENLNLPIMKDYQILKSTKTNEGKLIRIGNLLIDHSLSKQSLRSKADTYYTALFNEPEFMMTGACLTGQGWMAMKRGQFDLAIKLAQEALSIDNRSNTELTITTLNCLGGVYSKLKDYPKALEYYTKACNLSRPTDDNYHDPCIPIDKYAMYDNYRNISSINKACIYQKKGDFQLAWNMYKETIDYEMRDTTDFHCHTCMTIAESGTYESRITPEEQNRIWNNWKNFLDLGLTGILKYRTPVITGYLSLSHQYDFPSRRYNNDYCRRIAIDYFQKVENQCFPYVSNHQYYLYTLQCYERLAVLYQHWDNRSTDYYEKMIRLCLKCRPDDLENLIIGYKGMMETYKQQQLRRSDHSKDVSVLLCDDTNGLKSTMDPTLMTPPVTPMTPPVTPLTSPMFGRLFQNIKHLHFAFDSYDKSIDPRLKNELDFRKKIIYCHMKLAPLYYDQAKVADAKNSLIEAILLSRQFGPEMLDVSTICNENLSFIDTNFDFIIQSYKDRLPSSLNISGECIDENNYCNIAQLYEKKNDFNAALEFYRKPIEYFEEYNFVCLHTIDCFIKLAKFHQMVKYDKESTVTTYERAISLAKKHRSDPMTTIVSIVEEHLINYFKSISDLDTTIIIYETLCGIVQHETTDITVLYSHLRRIFKLLVHKYDAFNAILNTYDALLNLILQIISPLTSQMSLVLVHFRDQFINAYKNVNHLSSAIEIYQKLICLLFKHQNDTIKILSEYKTIAAGFATKHLLEYSITAYDKTLDFACQHHSTTGFLEGDLISFIFIVWRDRIIKQYLMEKNFESGINLHHKMICFLDEYRSNVNINYNLDEFISKTLQNYDGIVLIYQLEKNNLDKIFNIYQEQIEFLTKYQIETVQEHIRTIISKCQQFAEDYKEQAIELYMKLIIFIEKNRLQYLSHLSIAYKELAQLDLPDGIYSPNSTRAGDLNQRIFDYKQKAKHYLDKSQSDKAIAVYRKELLPFILENHARDDEQIVMCYRQMASLYYEQNENNCQEALNNYQKAIDIYETQKENFYTEYAFELNPNLGRRYAGTLFMCYNSMATIYAVLKDQISAERCRQQADDILEKHKEQFQFNRNPVTNIMTVEIRPYVELGY